MNSDDRAIVPLMHDEPEDTRPDLMGWVQDNPLIAAGIGFGLIAMLTGAPQNASLVSSQNAALRDYRQQTDAMLRQAEIEADMAAREAEIAARLQENCTLVTLRDGNEPVAISEGQIIVDKVSGYPIADGTRVCDPLGNVGTIEGGTVQNILRGPRIPLVEAVKPEPEQIISQEAIYVTEN